MVALMHVQSLLLILRNRSPHLGKTIHALDALLGSHHVLSFLMDELGCLMARVDGVLVEGRVGVGGMHEDLAG